MLTTRFYSGEQDRKRPASAVLTVGLSKTPSRSGPTPLSGQRTMIWSEKVLSGSTPSSHGL
jgi:hypothetical protein